MTDAPPPQMPPPDLPPPTPPAAEPGFVMCGLMFFGGFIAVGALAFLVESLFRGNTGSTGAGVVTLVALGVSIFYSVKNPRFGRCFFKGLAVNAAVAVVVFGVCVAMLASMYN